MNWAAHQSTTVSKTRISAADNGPRLRALIDEATTDSHDESDEHAGLLSMIREEVPCPFPASIRGEEVECLRLERPKKGYGMNVVCRWKNGRTHTVDIGTLEWMEPLPEGFRWIEAYFAWRDLLG